MRTPSSRDPDASATTRNPLFARVGFLVALALMGMVIQASVARSIRLASASTRHPASTIATIEAVLELAEWRTSVETTSALRAADDLNLLPVRIPEPPDLPAMRRSEDPDGRESAEPEGDDFLEATLAAEIAHCRMAIEYLQSRNELVGERDKLLQAHEDRVNELARRFPSITDGPLAFVPVLQRELEDLKEELRGMRITSRTYDTRGWNVGTGSSESGLEHWDIQLRTAERAIEESADIGRPYEAVLAAERAISGMDLIREEMDDMPSSPVRFGMPNLPGRTTLPRNIRLPRRPLGRARRMNRRLHR